MPGDTGSQNVVYQVTLFQVMVLLSFSAMPSAANSVQRRVVSQHSCTVTQHVLAEDDRHHPVKVVFNGTDNICYPLVEATCDNDKPMVCREDPVCSGTTTTTSTPQVRRRRRSLSLDDKERLYWKYMWSQGSSISEPESWRRRRRERWGRRGPPK